jgi:uncharacterized membrane protein YkvA (DUF1232 family)
MSQNRSVPNLPPGVEIIPPGHEPREGEPVAPVKFPWLQIIVMGLLALLYSGSPLDLIPDFIPVLGWMDDLFVDLGLFGLILRAIFKYYSLKATVGRGGSMKSALRSIFTRSVLKRVAK